MTDDILKKIKIDVLSIMQTKIEGIKMAKSIQDLIDNNLCSVMGCPRFYGLKEKDCRDNICEYCWQYDIECE